MMLDPVEGIPVPDGCFTCFQAGRLCDGLREELGAARLQLEVAEAKLKDVEGERQGDEQAAAALRGQGESDRSRIAELEESLANHKDFQKERDSLILSEAGLKESLEKALRERGELKTSLKDTLAILHGLEEKLAEREGAIRSLEGEVAAMNAALAEEKAISKRSLESRDDAVEKWRTEERRREEAEEAVRTARRAKDEAEKRAHDLESHIAVERATAASLSKTVEQARDDTRHYAGRAAEEGEALEREREQHREEVRLLNSKVASLVSKLEEGLRSEAQLRVKLGEISAREERERTKREAAELRWKDACLRVEEAIMTLEQQVGAVTLRAVGTRQLEALRREKDALQVRYLTSELPRLEFVCGKAYFLK